MTMPVKTETGRIKDVGILEGELDALRNQIIGTEYRNDPLQQLISEDDLRVKLNSDNFVRRFERENTNVLEFVSLKPFSKEIDIITKKMYDYASENRNGTN